MREAILIYPSAISIAPNTAFFPATHYTFAGSRNIWITTSNSSQAQNLTAIHEKYAGVNSIFIFLVNK